MPDSSGGGGVGHVVIVILAITVMPSMLAAMPTVDPLVVIMGIFAIIAIFQQLTGPSEAAGGAANGDGGARSRRGASASDEDEDSASGSAGAPVEKLLADAETALAQNSYERAEELARKATDADPESAKAWEVLATAQRWSGRRDEAAATVHKAMDIYELDSEGLLRLAQELDESKCPIVTAEACEQRAEEFFVKRQFDLAFDSYSKGLDAFAGGEPSEEAKPARLRLLRRRAECAQQLQDWGTCRRDATEVLKEDPRDPGALLRRAAANEALENFEAALKDARALLALDPKSAAANRLVHSCQRALR